MRWLVAEVSSVLLLIQGLPSCTPFQQARITAPSSTTTIANHGHRRMIQSGGSSTTSGLVEFQKRRTTTTSGTAATATTTSSTRLQAALSPALLVGAASPLVGAVGVLAFIVLIHELGHYLSARFFGITVTEFSIGFGPKLIGFTKFGNEFNIRALPLGGFVRFPENYDIQKVLDLEQQAEKIAQERRTRLGRDGPFDTVFNIATLGGLDEQLRKTEQLEQEQLAVLEAQNQPWWKKVLGGGGGSAAKGKARAPIDPEDYEVEYFDDPNLLQNRPWPERFVVLSGGVFMNMVLAFTLYFGVIGFGSGIPQPVFEPGVVISATPRANVPSSGLLQKGDIITGINGQRLILTTPTPMGAQKEVSNLISVIRATPDGGSVQLDVLRNGKNKGVIIEPKRNEPNGAKTIGVMLSPNFLEIQRVKADNVLQAAQLATRQLVDTSTQTLNGFGQIFSMMFSSKGAPPSQSFTGPIGLIKTGSEVVSTQDFTTVLLFAAAISINLGVANALPLPALDGGQLAFVIAEALTGRKVDQRFQEGITSVAVLLLLLFTVRTAFGDVESILGR